MELVGYTVITAEGGAESVSYVVVTVLLIVEFMFREAVMAEKTPAVTVMVQAGVSIVVARGGVTAVTCATVKAIPKIILANWGQTCGWFVGVTLLGSVFKIQAGFKPNFSRLASAFAVESGESIYQYLLK